MSPPALLLLLFLPFLPTYVISQPPEFILQSCSNDTGNYTAGSNYETNLHNVLSSMAADTHTTSGFYDVSSSHLGPDRVNAIGLCRGDVGPSKCQACIYDATRRILVDCPGRTEAFGWYDFCTIRYSNRLGYDGSLNLINLTLYTWNNSHNAIYDPTRFDAVLATLLTRLRETAADGDRKKFATGTARQGNYATIYGLVQCTPDLSRRDCDRCLEGAAAVIPTGKIGGRVVKRSCNLRFEIFSFYGEPAAPPRVSSVRLLSTLDQLSPAPSPFSSRRPTLNPSKSAPSPFSSRAPPTRNKPSLAPFPFTFLAPPPTIDQSASAPPSFSSLPPTFDQPSSAPSTFSSLPPTFFLGGGRSKNRLRLVFILVLVAGAAVLGVFFVLCTWWRIRKKRSRIDLNQQMAAIMSSDGPGKLLQFDFDAIKAATNNFEGGRKLGQGGFGAVYKGTLPDGQDIAVKRLSRHSKQGDLEFKNEGELVAKLQHRNLVRFLGFSMKRNERLLIYEFVPNASLDRFLFDPNRRGYLDWERRYKIICGVARGLVYLHEDSRLRIVHRDLKAGNILLDAEMNPKIADFGLARLFDFDETEGSTRRVVGTYGYMAPEYLIHGNFSIKSDVFSFGVLVLEIMSGQRNKLVRGGSTEEDLLTYAWKSWRNGTYSNLVDPSLRNNDVSCQTTRCIHIGLLCVQKNVNDRPTMTSVTQMLTNYSLSLPLPSPPAFFMQAGGAQEGVIVAAFSKSAGINEAAVPLSWNEVSMTDLCPR